MNKTTMKVLIISSLAAVAVVWASNNVDEVKKVIG